MKAAAETAAFNLALAQKAVIAFLFSGRLHARGGVNKSIGELVAAARAGAWMAQERAVRRLPGGVRAPLSEPFAMCAISAR